MIHGQSLGGYCGGFLLETGTVEGVNPDTVPPWEGPQLRGLPLLLTMNFPCVDEAVAMAISRLLSSSVF